MPLKVGNTSVVRLYKKEGSTQTEVTHLKDNINRSIHKRISIMFNANGGSGDSSQSRTWGVEQITVPPNPTRSGYTFQGWATSSGATSPNVSLPMITPDTNIMYYAVWKENAPELKWRYDGTTPIIMCACEGVPMIGTACSQQGLTMLRCASDEGYSGRCIVIKCDVV